MMYVLIIFMSLVACVMGFISEVTRCNIVHIKNGRKPEAGAAIFPTIPCVQILAVLLAWGLNRLHPFLGLYTVIALFVLLYVVWVLFYPKAKREFDELEKKRCGYCVKQVVERREQFGLYRYEILDGERVVAKYWHDHRGDDHGIEFADGTTEDWPVGRMTDFLTGGGPQPLRLSKDAITYLKGKLEQQPKGEQGNASL